MLSYVHTQMFFFATPADLIVNVVQQGKPSNVGVIKVGDVFHFYSIQLVYVIYSIDTR